MATAVASAYSDPDKEIISHYRGEVRNELNLEFNHTLWKPAHVSQGLETALKCCYENIEDTLTVPPEVCPSTFLLNRCHHNFIATEKLHWWNQDSALQLEGKEVNSVYLREKQSSSNLLISKISFSHNCFSSLFDKLDLQVRSSLSQALFLPWCGKFKFNFSLDIIGPCQPARHEHQNCPRIWDKLI